jgi:DNA-directed RNA polymerase I, II, and III subunit RPABC2
MSNEEEFIDEDFGAQEEEFDTEFPLEDEAAPAATIRPELKRLYQQHPECVLEYVESVIPKLPLKVNPPSRDNPDSNHKTYPFLTVYEKTKIIGLRSNQLSQGSRPFITVPEHVTDVREIARLELEQKRLPFIVKRPLPNGKYEYWRLADLMIL